MYTRLFISFLIIAFLGFTPCSTFGFQSTQEQDPETGPQTEQTEVDEQFQSLKEEFYDLYQYLSAKGVGEREKKEIANLRKRVREYHDAHPDHEGSLGLDLQLTIWLDQRDEASSLYEQLLEMQPEKSDAILASWAEYLLRENAYPAAEQMLQSRGLDWSQNPKAGLAMADIHIARNRFAEALTVLDEVSAGTEEGSSTASKATQLRSLATEYQQNWSTEQEIRTAEAQTNTLPRARLQTSKGAIVIELFEDQAPNTVENFVSLIQDGFYDQTTFHHIETNKRIIGGDPNTKPDSVSKPGRGNPGYQIPDEHTRDDVRMHFAGSVGMIMSGPTNSAGSRFYITYRPMKSLNNQRTVFGRVIEGMDVVYKLNKGDEITAATVLRKRDHEYDPATLPISDAASPAGQPNPFTTTPGE